MIIGYLSDNIWQHRNVTDPSDYVGEPIWIIQQGFKSKAKNIMIELTTPKYALDKIEGCSRYAKTQVGLIRNADPNM